MEVEIVGARDYSLDTEDGKHIQGVSLFMLYPERDVVGRVAEKRSYAGAFAGDFIIPGMYDVQFNPKGKIVSVTEM